MTSLQELFFITVVRKSTCIFASILLLRHSHQFFEQKHLKDFEDLVSPKRGFSRFGIQFLLDREFFSKNNFPRGTLRRDEGVDHSES